ncbi:MAG TPA: bifunctional demethylmenaquinone methyltransferase/2-methoxy-6-polyprenyl-1,4-benzoquinol methylase UbiE [Hyphomicrobiaceae bacterium]|nr:bifunctional demethylmenaquinone methyltransferase/2-methoxy-6-polyprenyl-1,4-benzoquinol methylase UbiE [Hyphomicrobiaceae bacterium]
MTNDPQQAGGRQTWFGLRRVPVAERQGLVNDVFSQVARHYDLMNDLMSGGLHRLWKDDLVAQLNPPRSAAPFRLIDAAGGTGDVALRALAAGGAGCEVVICDINAQMLEVGRRKVEAAGQAQRVKLVAANAEALPFADRSFDAYTVAFGIRNMTSIAKALNEAYRVLKIGGRFLCLEFSECQVPILDRLYDFHSFEVIPRLGRLVAGAEQPYRYLVESIRKFPNQERFAAMISEAGFERVGYRNLSGGIAAVHSGWRI